jgi:hypothetical protein
MNKLLGGCLALLAATCLIVALTACEEITGEVDIECELNAEAEGCWAAYTGDDLNHPNTIDGDVIVVSDNSTITDTYINGCLEIWGDNFVGRNLHIVSDHACANNAIVSTGINGSLTSSAKFYDTTIEGVNITGDVMGIGQSNWWCIRCEIKGVPKGAKADQNVVLSNSYLPSLANGSSTHQENFFYNGGAGNVLVWHNWMRAGDSSTPNVTGALSINNVNYASTGDVAVMSNYLEGVNGAGATGGDMCQPTPYSNIGFRDNAISPNNAWGVTFAYGFNSLDPNNDWTNNYNSVTLAPVTPSTSPCGH